MANNNYALGYSRRELERIGFQARMLNPITANMLRACGISAGKHVLDIGCGSGEVSRLAARLVGKEGRVTGVEQSPVALEHALKMNKDFEIKNIDYINDRLENIILEKSFDIVVGRAVLLFQEDVQIFLRKASQFVVPGGYLAFHEIDDARQFQSYPPVDLWDRTMAELLRRLREGCPQYDITQRFAREFCEAGLEMPRLSYEIPIACNNVEDLCFWAVETLSSLSHDPEKITFPDGKIVASNVLIQSLHEEIYKVRAHVEFLGQACAWVQIN